MRANEAELAEQKLNHLANIALYHQSIWLLILAVLLVLKPHYIKDAGQCLGVAALIASGIASKIYIHAGKKVEEFKTFSNEEAEKRKKEYLYRFFCPYILWVGCVVAFGSL